MFTGCIVVMGHPVQAIGMVVSSALWGAMLAT